MITLVVLKIRPLVVGIKSEEEVVGNQLLLVRQRIVNHCQMVMDQLVPNVYIHLPVYLIIWHVVKLVSGKYSIPLILSRFKRIFPGKFDPKNTNIPFQK